MIQIEHRSTIYAVVSEQFVTAYNWYEYDLANIQTLYNKHKVLYSNYGNVL